MNKFGERLKDLRVEYGLSRAQVAKELNVSARLVAYWEDGQRECPFDTLIAIANLFGTTTDYLLGRCDY